MRLCDVVLECNTGLEVAVFIQLILKKILQDINNCLTSLQYIYVHYLFCILYMFYSILHVSQYVTYITEYYMFYTMLYAL